MLAPASFLVAVVAGVVVAFTPLALLGPNVIVGVSCAFGPLTAFVGMALGVICLIEGRSSSADAHQRRAAINLGATGAILCTVSVLALFSLWLYLPTQIIYAPLWS